MAKHIGTVKRRASHSRGRERLSKRPPPPSDSTLYVCRHLLLCQCDDPATANATHGAMPPPPPSSPSSTLTAHYRTAVFDASLNPSVEISIFKRHPENARWFIKRSSVCLELLRFFKILPSLTSRVHKVYLRRCWIANAIVTKGKGISISAYLIIEMQ